MKRKAITILIAGTTFLSALGGVAVMLATGPNSVEMELRAQIQQNHTEQTPIAIAGNSWGGLADDTKPNPPPSGGGTTSDGNSWGVGFFQEKNN